MVLIVKNSLGTIEKVNLRNSNLKKIKKLKE